MYPIKENLLQQIQRTLICTATYALILYDMAWKLHEKRQIPIEHAVNSILSIHGLK